MLAKKKRNSSEVIFLHFRAAKTICGGIIT